MGENIDDNRDQWGLVGWDNDKINKWVVRCMDEVIVGMEQLRVQAEVEKGQRCCVWVHGNVQACVGMCNQGQTGARSRQVMSEGASMVQACMGMKQGVQGWIRAWACIDEGVGMCGHVWACAIKDGQGQGAGLGKLSQSVPRAKSHLVNTSSSLSGLLQRLLLGLP